MENRRRKNKMDMRITEQLDAIADKICEGYCKYSAEYTKGDTDRTEELIKEHCNGCPLLEL